MSKVNTISTAKLSSKDGKSRLWIEGKRLTQAGFVPGHTFVIEEAKQGIVLKLADLGTNKVAKRERAGGRVDSIVDITNQATLAPLQGCKVLRVVLGEGQIFISAVASELRLMRRLNRLKERLVNGEALETAGIAAGGGILSHAVHAGLDEAGVPVTFKAYNEIRDDLVEHALANNDIISDDTIVLNLPLQELAYDEATLKRVGEVDVMELGLPCSGASVAGRAKRKLDFPEAHPHVGHLAAGALAIIAKLNPAALIFENVVPYANTASACILRQQLGDMGYEVHERNVFGPDFGDFEERTRWCMVAMSKGIPFNFDEMPMPVVVPRQLKEVMEPPEAVADRWSMMEGLKAKQARDLDEGKNFKMQIFTGDESTIKTLTKGITKNRSTDPKFRHPTNPDLLRIPTAKEHGAYKGIPEHLFQGMSQTTANEMLGQSITYKAFKHVAAFVGTSVKQWADSFTGTVQKMLKDINDVAAASESAQLKVAA